MKPNKPLLRKWVAALRGGKYHQTKNRLCTIDGNQTFHCCLGVACRIAKKAGLDVGILKNDSDVTFFYEDDYRKFSLPNQLAYKFGITYSDQSFFVKINDTGYSFKDIADEIEKRYQL